MRLRRMSKYAVFIFFLLILMNLTFAQAGRGRGRIGGKVVNEDGIPIQSAKIIAYFAQNESIEREATTNDKGEWSIIGLGSGRWIITVSAKGYEPEISDVNVKQLERNPKITLTLKKIDKINRAIISDESSFAIMEKANKLLREKKYSEALTAYQQILEKNPSAYQAHLSIGTCYKELGDLNEAIVELNIVLEKSAGDDVRAMDMRANAYSSLGECYLKKDDFEKAEDYFKKSIEANPKNEVTVYNVGELYFSNQRIDEAIQYFGMSARIKPDWGYPYLKLAYAFLNKADYADAEINFQRFLDLEPEAPEVPQVKKMLEYLKTIHNSDKREKINHFLEN